VRVIPQIVGMMALDQVEVGADLVTSSRSHNATVLWRSRVLLSPDSHRNCRRRQRSGSVQRRLKSSHRRSCEGRGRGDDDGAASAGRESVREDQGSRVGDCRA
jgi:hypothetical protein